MKRKCAINKLFKQDNLQTQMQPALQNQKACQGRWPSKVYTMIFRLRDNILYDN